MGGSKKDKKKNMKQKEHKSLKPLLMVNLKNSKIQSEPKKLFSSAVYPIIFGGTAAAAMTQPWDTLKCWMQLVSPKEERPSMYSCCNLSPFVDCSPRNIYLYPHSFISKLVTLL